MSILILITVSFATRNVSSYWYFSHSLLGMCVINVKSIISRDRNDDVWCVYIAADLKKFLAFLFSIDIFFIFTYFAGTLMLSLTR